MALRAEVSAPPALPLAALALIATLALPILAGLAGTVLPAFGFLPALGQTEFGLAPFRALLEWPGFSSALWLSVKTGVLATVISLAITLVIVAGLQGTRLLDRMAAALSVLLALPHAAAALGLAFLLAPSGWIARALSPWLTGWDRPPDLLSVQDPGGWALMAGLVLKEVPFLLLVTLAALGQIRHTAHLRIARALGYTALSAWIKTVLPLVYRQIRLPIYAVLAYSMSVVDMALILGPNTPPPLSVQVVRWMNDPDLSLRLTAAAGALCQLGLVAGALALWRGAEIGIARAGDIWIGSGKRGAAWLSNAVIRLAQVLAALLVGVLLAAFVGLLVWSVAGLWRFPAVLPDSLSLRAWTRQGPDLGALAGETALIAAAATILALGLVLGCLQAEARRGLTPGGRALWILYLPLLVPQISFLTGLQTVSLLAGAPGGRGAVIVAHLIFVLPYVFLTLAAPWRAWDTRFASVGHSLGAGPWRVLLRIRLPMLLAPILTATAIGLSVSVGQYLPTLLIGGGRVETLTTQAVALAAGGDRRAIGVTAIVQTALALTPFLLAIGLPRWLNRGNRA